MSRLLELITQFLHRGFLMKLERNERILYENLADLYSIMVATEHLERAYIRDAISSQDYTSAMLKLIAQFKAAQGDINIPAFISDYQIKLPIAVKRLIELGVPATIEHQQSQGSSKNIAESVQFYITLMDSLKLNLVAVDQIHPQLSDLVSSLTKLSLTERTKPKLMQWLITLNKLK